jgi:uncharacterized protein YaaW (UPF0174 family)
MKIPKTLKIGGVVYKIELVRMDNLCGEYDATTGTIRINPDMPQDLQEETLIHEALHGINNELDEREIEFLSQALYQMLKDNNLLK